MTSKIYSILLIASLLLFSCNDDTKEIVDPIIEGTEITSFSFLKANNPSLESDLYLDFQDKSLTGRLSLNVDVENLVATFEHDGLEVVIGDVKQISGTTYNNFQGQVTYTVKTTNGLEDNYIVDLTYFTGLPIIYLYTDAPIDSKDEYRVGTASIYGGENFDTLSDAEIEIRGRGNSTWGHPKKPYQFKFSDKTAMLNMPADKKWIFLAEYSDKTMIRNKIAFEMGYISNLDWTPKSEFADVFINDEYNGTYHISQKVEESNNRVALGDTGYLLEIDQESRMDPDDVYFYTGDFLINIKEPSLDYGSTEFNFSKDLLNEFEAVLHGGDFKDINNGYAKYIDVDSFVDWFLISEITKNVDSKHFSSIFLNVIPGEKIKMGPLWDFDLAFGNVDYADSRYYEGYWVKEHKWYVRLFQDPAFVAKVKTRFAYFKENQNFILDKMDYYSNYIGLSQIENDDKWNLIGNYVWPNPVVYNTYEEEVNHLKDWYTKRMNWLDTAFKGL